jgi:hypothetical protein
MEYLKTTINGQLQKKEIFDIDHIFAKPATNVKLVKYFPTTVN